MYGPVKAEATTGAPFTIIFDLNGPMEYDATNAWFSHMIQGRTITLARNSTATLPAGIYTVFPKLTGANRLLCNVPGLANTPVADFIYTFAVDPDCNDNRVLDGTDIVNGTSQDVNLNGVPDSCENRICSSCAADFDGNGGVTGDDVAEFFTDFQQGLSCADVNVDGGVTGDDVAFFFTVFEAGGC